MKKVLSLMVTLCVMMALVPVVHAEQPYEISLNGEWDFKYYANASAVPEDVTSIVFEDKIQVPGAMELSGYGYPSYYYEEMGGWGQPEDDGVRSAGVYKTEFTRMTDNLCFLCIDSFEDSLTVYLNGEKIGESKNGALGDDFILPYHGGVNTLVCVVKRDNSGINKKDDFALSGLMGNVTITNAITHSKAENNVEVKNNVLTVDGKEVVLKGVKYTPTHPETGNVITNEQIDKDLELIKEYGFNAVWVSCAPEYFYAKAKKSGLYVIDEANVNLSYADRDMDTAKKRVEEMIKNHSGGAVIMWSVGFGDGNGGQLIETVKALDTRPVAQEVNFAPDFEIFGNTGGMKEWVDTLGTGNVGGFVDEFADKELYYTQHSYVFETKDEVTGETVTIDGEIKNYKGMDMLGKGEFERAIQNLDKYTVVTDVSAVDGDRVIFESGDVKFEIQGNRVRFNAGGKRIRADVSEGKVAAIYADGEIQLFVNNGFVGNEVAEAEVESGYKVGGGDTAIGYIEIYNDALTLDELIEGADKEKLISRVDFDDINIKEDNSYEFLAYGGDFGDSPNSYYKCLTGIFSSTREPHPEAEEFKAILTGEAPDGRENTEYESFELVVPTVGENTIVFEGGNVKVNVGYDGKITSITDKKGKELLLDAMYPTTIRENTLSEYEMGIEQDEEWRAGKAQVIDNVLYVELISTETDGRLNLAYKMAENGVMHVSVQSQFGDDAIKPTFIGFRGVGNYTEATWVGYEGSNYPDRRGAGEIGVYTKPIAKMGDNYPVPQENGNRMAYGMMLNNDAEDILLFATVSVEDVLECQVLDYSPEAMDNADHDEDIVKDGKAYFRIGGYIKGVSSSRDYELNENVCGYDFYIITDAVYAAPDVTSVKEIYVNGEEYKAFAPGVYDYVYRTNEAVEVTADGAEVVQDDEKAVIGDYTVYFAPDNAYLSDMEAKNATAQIAVDCDFSGNALTMRGSDYWAPSVTYDKGITLKGGSVTYDVSNMTSHTFNAVVGKNDMDWRRMGGNFDRNMFSASAKVTIALDGVVVYEKNDVSMRSNSEEVSIDVSTAKEMTITVTGSGAAPQYEDAVLANSAFVPNGPVVVNFENRDGKVEITVLNTDEDYVDVVLSVNDNGQIKTEATRIAKGLYRTISIDASESCVAQATITHLGTVTLE